MRLPKIPQGFVNFIVAFAVGVLVGLVVPVLLILLVAKQDLVAESTVRIISTDSSQGDRSLKWVFKIQPKKILNLWERPNPIGAFVHLESGYDAYGEMQDVDLREFKGLRFHATSSPGDVVLRFNLFVGPSFVQYVLGGPPLRVDMRWREFYVDFDELFLAPSLGGSAHSGAGPDLCCVTALGLDVTTSGSPLEATVLLDDIRLVRRHGSEVILEDFESRNVSTPFAFQGRKLRWKTGVQTFH